MNLMIHLSRELLYVLKEFPLAVGVIILLVPILISDTAVGYPSKGATKNWGKNTSVHV